jgi:hypothetical protein
MCNLLDATQKVCSIKKTLVFSKVDTMGCKYDDFDPKETLTPDCPINFLDLDINYFFKLDVFKSRLTKGGSLQVPYPGAFAAGGLTPIEAHRSPSG